MSVAPRRIQCSQCRKDFPPTFRICPNCGSILSADTAPSKTKASPQLTVPMQTAKLQTNAQIPINTQSHNQTQQIKAGAHNAMQRQWTLAPNAPWRRYAARILDLNVNGFLMVAFLGFAFYLLAPAQADEFFQYLSKPEGHVISYIATPLAATLLTGLVIGMTGSSLGKLIFGIQVSRHDGSPIGIANGLNRDLTIWLKGIALGIPFINLVTLIACHQRLKYAGSTSWDEGKYTISYRPTGTTQYLLNFLGILLIITTTVALYAFAAVE